MPPGSLSKRDLAEKLARCSDEEIQEYHQKRLKKSKLFYIIALACGIAVIPFAIMGNLWATIAIGGIGVAFVQVGRYKKAEWLRIYHYLMALRRQQQKSQEDADLRKGPRGAKYRRHGTQPTTSN
ncbi:MAG TPA: hypothetical protein VKK79_09300 [Candidatus Lokiarchaeia archaeon]|nr:hypothetical protein [Candidatus Lokiarchaeia archaeon]